ncbi:MAG: sigma-70 family RNA polymerase sigma factor [Abditibacteriales bacterium]|nr:sigma-70 family RNA polymerase sigma factor [Abditibacteriales bacterium]MDW8367817.1 sigma-70 family RNA polymerase sigma factor [Abditibacteriales bacterium]
MLASYNSGAPALREHRVPSRQGAADDDAAFERTVRLYKDRIFHYVCRLTGDMEEAEDITQEVFVRAYRSRETFRGECSYLTWLYRIAINLCIDRARDRQRRLEDAISLDAPSDDEDGLGWEPSDWSQDPCRELERAELRDRVQQSVRTLPDKLRSVVVLYFMQGLSYEEIASTLDCSIGTVKSRLFNAKARLARKLRSYVEGTM